MENKNNFSNKFALKSNIELNYIIEHHKDYQKEAVQAAELELRNRDNTSSESIHQPLKDTGEEIYQDFINEIKKKPSFKYTPKYSETFQSTLPTDLITELSTRVFEKLEWDLVYRGEKLVEAKRKNHFGQWREKIIIQVHPHGMVEVTSKSLKDNFWDIGRNSIRVKLFIHAFQELAKEYDDKELATLSAEIEHQKNGGDYEVPENLPQPNAYKEPNVIFIVISAIITSIALGYLFAIVSTQLYIILLYEFALGITLAFILFQGVKLGNYTHDVKIRTILIFSIIGIVGLNQYFQYLIILDENQKELLSFFDYMANRMNVGFSINGVNLGWGGWLIIFIIQLFLLYFISYFRLSILIMAYQIERIPEEVINFALFHVNKNKDVDQLRKELALKGWIKKEHQDFVFKALGAIYSNQEIRRG